MRLPPVFAGIVAVAVLMAGTALAQSNVGSTIRFVQPVQVKHAITSQTPAQEKIPAVPADEMPLLPIIDNFLGYDDLVDDQGYIPPPSYRRETYPVTTSGHGPSCAAAPADCCPAPQSCCDAAPCCKKKGLLEWLGLDCRSCKPTCCQAEPCCQAKPCCSKKAPCCRKQYKSLIELLGWDKKCCAKASSCGCDGRPHDCACDGKGHHHGCGCDGGHVHHGGCDGSLAHQSCGCDSGPNYWGPSK